MAEILELVRALDGDLPRLLLDSVVDYAVFVIDPDGRIISWNPGAERIKGWRRDEIIGQHFSVFYTPEDVADGKPWRALEQVEEDGRLIDQGWRVRKDGSTFWADVVITALRDAEGTLVGFAKVTRDLTDRKNSSDADRALAVLHERERIARELHHTVIRTLFGIGLSLQAGALETKDRALRSRLDGAIEELDRAIKEVREHVLHQETSGPAAAPDVSKPAPTPKRGRASASGARPLADNSQGRRHARRGGSRRAPSAR